MLSLITRTPGRYLGMSGDAGKSLQCVTLQVGDECRERGDEAQDAGSEQNDVFDELSTL